MDETADCLWLEEPILEEDETKPNDTGLRNGWGRGRGLLAAAVIAAAFGVGLAVQCMIDHVGASTRSAQSADSTSQESFSGSDQIKVDVRGDVLRPGVYALKGDARVQDAVQAAGGYVHQADRASVNEALPLDDGADVIVPQVGQSAVSPQTVESIGTIGPGDQNAASTAALGPGPSAQVSVALPRINLNTATAASLETIPGIGPKRAQAVIQYRTQHGPFRDLQDLLNVRGIGPTLLKRMVPYLFVENGRSGHKS